MKWKMKTILDEVKKKRELSGLPDSIIKNSMLNIEEIKGKKSYNVKEIRAQLRKYFGVFLTNKVVKPKDMMDYVSILNSHKSSSQRNYNLFYKELFDGESFDIVFDLGCGANGFSFPFLLKENVSKYVGVEASRILVENMNIFFRKNKFNARGVWMDLFCFGKLKKLISSEKEKKVIFCFQVIDALEKLKKGYGYSFIEGLLKIISKGDIIIISFPLKNLSGRRDLAVKRNWLIDFLEGKASIRRDIVIGNERFIIIENL